MFTVLDTWRDRWLWHFVRNRYSYAIEITSTHRYPSNINVLRHRWMSSAAQLLWFFFRSLALGIFIITRWKCRRYTYNNYLDCNYFFSSPIHPSITFLRFFVFFFVPFLLLFTCIPWTSNKKFFSVFRLFEYNYVHVWQTHNKIHTMNIWWQFMS